MDKLFRRLLAGLALSAVVMGGTAWIEHVVVPGSIPGLAAFAQQLPHAVRFDCETNRSGVDGQMPLQYTVRAYDRNHRLVGTLWAGGELSTTCMETLQYDAAGNCTGSTYHGGEGTVSQTRFAYDGQGRKHVEERYREGMLEYAAFYTYTPQADGTWLCRMAEHSKARGMIENSWVTDYAGRMLYMQSPNGAFCMESAYDEKGRETHTVIRKYGVVDQENFYTYIDAPDGSGTCTEEYYSAGVLALRIKRIFDAQGICIREIYTGDTAGNGETVRTVRTLKR